MEYPEYEEDQPQEHMISKLHIYERNLIINKEKNIKRDENKIQFIGNGQEFDPKIRRGSEYRGGHEL